jgi:beta-glucosidase
MSSNPREAVGRYKVWLLAAMGASVIGLTACSSTHSVPRNSTSQVGAVAKCPWLNTKLSISRRVAMVMSKMTVADEIAMVEGHGFKPYVGNTPGDATLCIPSLGFEDGPNGVGDGLTHVTNLPSGASLAASFSRSLAYKYGRVIGAEQAAKGAAVDLGPTVNIDRDPRWGREFESLSEDPVLASEMGVAEIHGIQGTGTIAQVKHLDAYNQETNRNTAKDDVQVSERALHELYMPAFRAAIRSGDVGSLMCAYSTVNGQYSCENDYLLTKVLRDEWNFRGFVTSDWFAVHSLSAATAGTDMEQPLSRFFGAKLHSAVMKGTIPRARLNTMVEPILYEMFRFHLFHHPRTGSVDAVATTPAHQKVSTEIAQAGTVLLKNEDHLLPLSAAERIAVIGPAASKQVTYGGGGSAYVIPSSTVTPLAGIRAAAGASSSIVYAQGLPTHVDLQAIPAGNLSPPYSGTKPGGSYSASLRAPETGTYIIGFANDCRCYKSVALKINGVPVVDNAGTAPVGMFAGTAHLKKGLRYRITLAGLGSSHNLVWATPTEVTSYIQRAVAAARAARVAVVVVADDTESEGVDRPGLHLPSAQDELIGAVAHANPRTVVVVQAGAPIVMPWLHHVRAILDTWYPGQTNGTALGNVLFGKVDPSGHLPVTFPSRLADVPASSRARFPGIDGKVRYSEGLLVGYRWYEAKHIKPMFPFGFGLSYTHFKYSDLRLDRAIVDGISPIRVSARVTNAGPVAGTDVAQLYLGMPRVTGEPPRKLVGFQRVTLAPGESKVVHFTIVPREEWWWGHDGWTESAGMYQVYVGDSSALANLPLRTRYRMRSSIGDRQVTVAAPKQFKADKSSVVRVSLSAGGDEVLRGVELTLAAPGGWRIVPLHPKANGMLRPKEAATEQFAVTPPSWAVTQYVTLYGMAELSSESCAGNAHRVGQRPDEMTPGAAARCGVTRDSGKTVLVE